MLDADADATEYPAEVLSPSGRWRNYWLAAISSLSARGSGKRQAGGCLARARSVVWSLVLVPRVYVLLKFKISCDGQENSRAKALGCERSIKTERSTGSQVSLNC